MFFVTLNSKGGVGKTVVTQQVVAPFVSIKNGNKKIEIIEIDSANESNMLNKSEVLEVKTLDTKAGETILEDKFHEVLFEDKDVVVDVGGGTDTQKVVETFKKLEITEAVFFIPLLLDKANMKNVLDVYNSIRIWNKESKIVFVLNGYKSDEEFVYFYGDDSLEIKGIKDEFKSDKKITIIKLPFTVAYSIVADKLAKTVYEFGSLEIDTKEFVKQAKEEKLTKEQFKKHLLKLKIYKEAKAVYQNDLEPIFKQLSKSL